MAKQTKRPLTLEEETLLQSLQDRASRLERARAPAAGQAYTELCRYCEKLARRGA
jgi:hypothetical protein